VKIKTYGTVILPVLLYDSGILPLTLKEECRLRVFENSVLRRIFGPKRDEVKWGREDYKTTSFCSVLLTKYYSGY
jgi:hypothetical protein